MHISGLEVEGHHPRALMESALICLKQVIGPLRRPSPRVRFEISRSRRFCHHSNHSAVPLETFLFPPSWRGGTLHHAPTGAQITRAFLLALLFRDPLARTVLLVGRAVDNGSRAVNQQHPPSMDRLAW